MLAGNNSKLVKAPCLHEIGNSLIQVHQRARSSQPDHRASGTAEVGRLSISYDMHTEKDRQREAVLDKNNQQLNYSVDPDELSGRLT